jgi:hypothetical protein
MLQDLMAHGVQSRFAEKLKATPIWELKTQSRGGIKGGCRVYWFPLTVNYAASTTQAAYSETFAVIACAEVKTGNDIHQTRLKEAVAIYLQLKADPQALLALSNNPSGGKQ